MAAGATGRLADRFRGSWQGDVRRVANFESVPERGVIFWMQFADDARRPDPPENAPPEPSMFSDADDDQQLTADDLLPPTSAAPPTDEDLDPETAEAVDPVDDAVDDDAAEASVAYTEAHGLVVPQAAADALDERTSKLVPWAISILAHAALILVAIFVVWSVRSIADDEEEIIAILTLSETPAAPLQQQVEQRVETTQASASPAPAPSPSPSPLQSDVTVDLALPSLNTSITQGPSFDLNVGDTGAFAANFLGSGGNAKNVVFLVDASGSLVDTLPFIQLELQKSIRKLSEKQKFTVLFFQSDNIIEAEPRGMRNASADLKAQRIAWVDPLARNVTTAGGGDPVDAITKALAIRPEPDLIFLLSDNITGRGKYAIDQQRLLDSIDRANRGRTKINTLQFLYPDPLEDKAAGRSGTLERIAQQTGGEYTFVDAAALGIDE